ncbi:hypothetical protein [Kiloniella laminariae]|uniref:hypothetical protein n=1 Tax=Kiloniella laminariae TaxID=454162 RepID=UPI00036ACC77|nr:hypothetical protein [Kiloniella laminariae]
MPNVIFFDDAYNLKLLKQDDLDKATANTIADNGRPLGPWLLLTTVLLIAQAFASSNVFGSDDPAAIRTPRPGQSRSVRGSANGVRTNVRPSRKEAQ